MPPPAMHPQTTPRTQLRVPEGDPELTSFWVECVWLGPCMQLPGSPSPRHRASAAILPDRTKSLTIGASGIANIMVPSIYYMDMYAWVYVYIYVYMVIVTCVHRLSYLFLHSLYTHTCTYIYIYIYMCIYAHVVFVHLYLHLHVCSHVRCIAMAIPSR